jgi:hypothetical protein
VGPKSGQPRVIGPGYFIMPFKMKKCESQCVTTSKRIGCSSFYKWMTSVGVTNAQHPKNVGVIVLTIEGRPNLPKKTRIMASWRSRWLIKPQKNFEPNNFSNIIMVWI